jgi:hypothetical protein
MAFAASTFCNVLMCKTAYLLTSVHNGSASINPATVCTFQRPETRGGDLVAVQADNYRSCIRRTRVKSWAVLSQTSSELGGWSRWRKPERSAEAGRTRWVRPKKASTQVVHGTSARNQLTSHDLHIIDELAAIHHHANRRDVANVKPAIGFYEASGRAEIEHTHLTVSCDDAESLRYDRRICVCLVPHQSRL